jgi:hypothetical protein
LHEARHSCPAQTWTQQRGTSCQPRRQRGRGHGVRVQPEPARLASSELDDNLRAHGKLSARDISGVALPSDSRQPLRARSGACHGIWPPRKADVDSSTTQPSPTLPDHRIDSANSRQLASFSLSAAQSVGAGSASASRQPSARQPSIPSCIASTEVRIGQPVEEICDNSASLTLLASSAAGHHHLSCLDSAVISNRGIYHSAA